MKLHYAKTIFAFLLLLGIWGQQPLHSQCLMRPISLQQRSVESAYIVLGRLVSKESYWDQAHQNIYTLNIFEVQSWLKGYQPKQRVGIISIGGFVGDKGQITHPSLELDPYNEYVLFLNADNHEIDNKVIRQSQPDLIQAEPYASSQGALTKQSGLYHDLLSEKPQDEADLLDKIADFTGQNAKTPQGQPFSAREGDTFPLYEWASSVQRQMPITSFLPGTTRAGTIVSGDFVTITGSGFGAGAGTVFYTNADDGGATFTSSGVASDNVAWSDASIQNKTARRAGTGPINVNGAMTSGSNLTVTYSHLDINSTFSGFGSSTRQRYYLVNKNGTGGYTFIYNTAYSGNALAVASFERALATWRCATFVNFNINKSSTTAIATAALDGVNVVCFDATLPIGVLGRATSRFNGSATGGCNLANTIWWTDEIDVQFFPDPPTAGFPWEYGPAAPAFTEYDFESVAVHELGHAHGLGHVIQAGTVMHFALANGQNTRALGINEINGGLAKMAYSTGALCFNPATVTGPMIALTAGNCILPVQFISFTGESISGQGNHLQWTLSHELENAGFMVERSLDGTHFIDIGEVPGRGNSQTEVSYDYMDRSPATGIVNYYRLRQIDKNGTESHSETIAIHNLDGPSIQVLPTRVKDKLRILGDGGSFPGLVFSITNVQGARVLLRTLPQAQIDTEVDLGGFSAGMYFFEVRSNQGTLMSGKLIKE